MEGYVDAIVDAVDQPYLATLSEALPTDVGSQPDTSVMAQPLLTPDATVSPTAFLTLPANLAHGQPEVVSIFDTDPGNGNVNVNGGGNGNGLASADFITAPDFLSPHPTSTHYASFTTTNLILSASTVSLPLTTSVITGHAVLISSKTGTDQRTLTTEQNTIPGQTGLTSSTTPSSNPNASQTKAIAGGVTGASLILILGAIVFCILRRKRRYRAAGSPSSHEVPTSSDTPGQSLPQSAHLSTTPQPFLDFRLMQNQPSSKGILTAHASLLTRNNQGDIEQAADPFKDPVPATGGLSNNDDEVQRVRDTLDRLQALTSRFEREVQQLGVLAKSGQLSAEDRLRLEEIRRTTGLKIPWDSSDDRISMARSSSGSSSSPPSYHTHGS